MERYERSEWRTQRRHKELDRLHRQRTPWRKAVGLLRFLERLLRYPERWPFDITENMCLVELNLHPDAHFRGRVARDLVRQVKALLAPRLEEGWAAAMLFFVRF